MGRTAKKTDHLQPGQPAKPSNLSARASTEWDRLAGELSASGIVLTPGHRTVLSQAATLSADIAEAWARVEQDGAYIATKAGLASHPASKRLDALRRDYLKVLVHLGLRAAAAAPPAADGTMDEELDD